MRSGWIGIGVGSWSNLGIDGFYWSDVTSSKHNSGAMMASVYSLYFNLEDAHPNDGPNLLRNGFPLRCLVIGGEIRLDEYS